MLAMSIGTLEGSKKVSKKPLTKEVKKAIEIITEVAVEIAKMGDDELLTGTLRQLLGLCDIKAYIKEKESS